MSKPPESPPNSDIDGVHQDGTRSGKVIKHDEGSAKELDEARKESTGRPAEGKPD